MENSKIRFEFGMPSHSHVLNTLSLACGTVLKVGDFLDGEACCHKPVIIGESLKAVPLHGSNLRFLPSLEHE